MFEKPFSIVMDEYAHAALKRRSKTLNLKIGVFIENLLASLELRLSAAYEAGKIKKEDITPELDKKAIELLLTADTEKWDTERIRIEFSDLHGDLLKDKGDKILWTPKISLSKDKDDPKKDE